MEKKYHISKSLDIPKSMDYAFLKDEGIRLVQQLSSDIWTDYNSHDPGVTILESLCYAITELGYRIDFDIEQILTNNQGTVEQLEGHTFFPMKDMLPSSVVTIYDYRKYFLDHVRFSFSANGEFEPDESGMRVLTNVWINPTVNKGIPGLYRILIQIDDDYLLYKEEIKKEVIRLFLQNRNLGEDIYEVVVLKEYPITIKASIDLSPEAIPEAVLAQILFELEMVVTPRIKRHSINDLKQQGYTMEEIFEGPLPQSSFVKDGDLNKFTTIIYKPRLEKAIASIKGVRRIRSFQVYKRNVPVSEDIISLDDAEDCFPVIDTLQVIEDLKNHKQTFEFFQSNNRVDVDANNADHILKGLWSNFENDYALSDIDKPSPQHTKSAKPLDIVAPIAHLFPEVYGIGKRGLPASASTARKHKAEQLKTYLLLFDQLIANYLSQLTHVHSLFSTNLNIRNTYATRFPASFNLDQFSIQEIIRAKIYRERSYIDAHKNILHIVAEEIKEIVKNEEKENKSKKVRFSLSEKILIIDEVIHQRAEIVREKISALSTQEIKVKIEQLKEGLFEKIWKDWQKNEADNPNSEILENISKQEGRNLFWDALGIGELTHEIKNKFKENPDILNQIQLGLRKASAQYILDLLKRQQMENKAIMYARYEEILGSDKKIIKKAISSIESKVKNDETLSQLHKPVSPFYLLEAFFESLAKNIGIEVLEFDHRRLKVKERKQLLFDVLGEEKGLRKRTKLAKWSSEDLKVYRSISKFVSQDLFQFWSKAQKPLQIHDSFIKRKNKFSDHLLARFGESYFEDITEARMALNPSIQKEDFEKYLIQTKLNIVKEIADLSKNRSKAFDYAQLDRGQKNSLNWDNSSGFERKLSLLLDIPYAGSPFIKNILDKTRIGFSSINSKSGRKHPRSNEILNAFLSLGHLEGFYEKNEVRGADNKVEKYQLIFRLKSENEAILLYESEKSEKINSTKAKLIKFAKAIQKKTEAFYLIEHILLRPLRPVKYQYSFPVGEDFTSKKMVSGWFEEKVMSKFVSDLIAFSSPKEGTTFSLNLIKDPSLTQLNKTHKELIDKLKDDSLDQEQKDRIEKRINNTIKRAKKELLEQALETPGLSEEETEALQLEVSRTEMAKTLEADGIYRIALLDFNGDVFVQSSQIFIDKLDAVNNLDDFQLMLNELVERLETKLSRNSDDIYDEIDEIEDPKDIESLNDQVGKDGSFFHHQVSLIFPAWCERLKNRSFQKLLQTMIIKNFPAHLKLKIHWLNVSQMIEFEPMYAAWLRYKGRDNLNTLDKASSELKSFLLKDHPLTV